MAGTAGGSRQNPAWLRNVKTHPEVTIETGNRTLVARASLADAADRAKLWDQHVVALPHFAAYPDQVGREIPMLRLTPTS